MRGAMNITTNFQALLEARESFS